eukprot:4080891-Amphidinium_carterae.1
MSLDLEDIKLKRVLDRTQSPPQRPVRTTVLEQLPRGTLSACNNRRVVHMDVHAGTKRMLSCPYEGIELSLKNASVGGPV